MALGEVGLAQSRPLAFDEAFPRLFSVAYRVAFRLLGDRSEAEDVAQEACARAYSRWARVADYAEPWCVRVAGNLALDVLRARTRAAKRSGGEGEPAAAASVIDERVDLQRALAALPRRQREAVVLRYLGDQSEQQTATILGCSVGSVKTHASRGLARLREVIGR